jgi:hypothetical protein
VTNNECSRRAEDLSWDEDSTRDAGCTASSRFEGGGAAALNVDDAPSTNVEGGASFLFVWRLSDGAGEAVFVAVDTDDLMSIPVNRSGVTWPGDASSV